MAAQQGSMKHTYAQREQDLNIIAGQSGLVHVSRILKVVP